jgi:hypothetical protein
VAREPGDCEHGVVLWSHARELLRLVRPQAWVVLQDLALDAEWRDGRLVASSSARLVAEHLHIDPGTAATALRILRDRGIVELTQASGAGGRFGLAAYTLLLPQGLEVISPHVDEPCTARPRRELANRVEPVLHPPCLENPHTVTSSTKGTTASPPPLARPRRRRAAAPGESSQGVLELGGGDW